MSERVEKLVAELTLDEKAALTAGADMWQTAAVSRLGIPPVRVTDGPNGARGSVMGSSGPASVCIPCGSALGATWDAGLVEEVGALLGDEARSKGARVLLAPTVNMHRSPLAGRNFECYSEDPFLAGTLASGFVRGVQARGVATTVKHLVGNDAEFERHSISSVIDERTLREIYLVPFEMAIRAGGSMGVMTAYNRLNGAFTTQRRDLLEGVLRQEWGFDGFVISDWYGVATTAESAAAGLDLEMPGPGRAFGPALAEAVRAGRVPEAELDGAVRRLLAVFDRVGALDDDGPGAEESIDSAQRRSVARRAASAATVLLVNDGLLPFDPTALRNVAVIGPNASRPQMMGGGSAAVRPQYRVSAVDALAEALGPDVSVVHEPGCHIERGVPTLKAEHLRTPEGGPGWALEIFASPDRSGPVAHRQVLADTRFFCLGSPAPGLPDHGFSLQARAEFTPDHSGPHRFELIQAGRARLLIDGEAVLDGTVDPPRPGTEFFGLGSEPISATVELAAGRPVDLVVEYSSEGSAAVFGVRVGCGRPWPEDLMERAEVAAAAADAVVVVVGTNEDWESEGHDRSFIALPGRQDELVERMVAANPNTVVVVNTGAAVTMPWAVRVRAALQVWFGGQEMSSALADVLLGRTDPGGRLPITIPRSIEDNPSYGNFPGANGEVRYGEGLLIGYRWYESRRVPVTFPFGHGLSYAEFVMGPPELSAPEFRPGTTLNVSVPVTNRSDRAGSEVVQLYLRPLAARAFRPSRELKGMAKLHLGPGDEGTAVIELDDRAFARWDPGKPAWAVAAGAGPEERGAGWVVDPGPYELCIGRSSAETLHSLVVEVAG